jgi:hypothetical protein
MKGARPLEVLVVEIDRGIGRTRRQDLDNSLVHPLGLAGPLQQSTHLLECEVGPAGEDEEEVLVGVPLHPLDGLDAGLRDRLVGVEALSETVIARARPAFDEGGGGVAGSFEHFGERVGLIRHVIARRPQPVGGRVEAAEEGRQRRL